MKHSSGFLIESDNKFLICHATNINQVSDVRRWGIPKGMMEHKETPLQTALRETLEETSLDLYALEKINLVHLESFPIYRYQLPGKIVDVFYALDLGISLKHKELFCSTLITGTDKPENDDFVWLPQSDCRMMVFSSQKCLFETTVASRIKVIKERIGVSEKR